MADTVDINASCSYLHRVMNRCADAGFMSDVDLGGLDAPAGMGLMLRGDGESARLLDGLVTFDPPLAAGDAAAWFERVVTMRDDSLRVLLVAPDDHEWSQFGPTRVTLAFGPRPTPTVPISTARIVFPDQYTSPTGMVIGMVLEDSDVSPIDLVANTADDGPIRALASVSGSPEPATGDHSSGVLWCDDAASLFGGWNHMGMWFGMPPTFVPVASVGVDGMTWGFMWDRPDQPIDDGLLFQISPGGRFMLEEVRSTKRYLVAELDDRRRRTEDPELLAEWTQPLAGLADERERERDAVVDGEISRRSVVESVDGERWLAMTSGDAIRVPADSVDDRGAGFSGSLIESIQHAQTQLDAGFAGSAYRSAYEGLINASYYQRGFEIHAAYAAMIGPLRRLGRDLFADRCAAIISEAAPMCHEVPGMVWAAPRAQAPAASPIWMVPLPVARPNLDVRELIEPGSQLRFDAHGTPVVVDTMAMKPLMPSDLPGQTLIALLDSSAVAVSPSDEFVSEHGKAIIGAVVDGRLVVGSVWDLPPGPGVSVEVVVEWSDDTARFRPVRYVTVTPDGDPIIDEGKAKSMRFDSKAPLDAVPWPFEGAAAVVDQLGASINASGEAFDVLTAPTARQPGLFVTDRVADVLAPDGSASEFSIRIGDGAVTRRFVNVPIHLDVDYSRSSFAETSRGTPPTVIERLAPGVVDGSVDLRSRRQTAVGERGNACDPHVIVVDHAPPVWCPLLSGMFVREDVRNELLAMGVTGCSFGERSPIVLEKISD